MIQFKYREWMPKNRLIGHRRSSSVLGSTASRKTGTTEMSRKVMYAPIANFTELSEWSEGRYMQMKNLGNISAFKTQTLERVEAYNVNQRTATTVV
jgi:hypothetical protein